MEEQTRNDAVQALAGPGQQRARRGFTARARRRLLFLTLVSGVLLAVFYGASFVLLGQDPPAFNGTYIDPPIPAADFELRNHRGETFQLEDSRGKVVVLTFLFTNCTDVCPFIAAKFKQAMDSLGEDASRVEFIAITSDPERDTPERVTDYSRQFGLYDRWHYLLGTREELKPIWDAYYVGDPLITENPVWASEDDLKFYGLYRGLGQDSIETANRVRGQFGGGYAVGHGAPVWLIDVEGQIQVKLGPDLAPEELVEDLRQLLAEGS